MLLTLIHYKVRSFFTVNSLGELGHDIICMKYMDINY